MIGGMLIRHAANVYYAAPAKHPSSDWSLANEWPVTWRECTPAAELVWKQRLGGDEQTVRTRRQPLKSALRQSGRPNASWPCCTGSTCRRAQRWRRPRWPCSMQWARGGQARTMAGLRLLTLAGGWAYTMMHSKNAPAPAMIPIRVDQSSSQHASSVWVQQVSPSQHLVFLKVRPQDPTYMLVSAHEAPAV